MELDFLYPSEGIHRRWDAGYRITSTAATWDQAAFVLSVPRRKPADETQETLRTSAFPSTHVKVFNIDIFILFVLKIYNSSLFLSYFFLCFIYYGGFLAGEMGEESLYCICLLWEDCFMKHPNFGISHVLFCCNLVQLMIMPSHLTHHVTKEFRFTKVSACYVKCLCHQSEDGISFW